MASYINLTLDNTGVTPLAISINNGEVRTGSTAVTVSITLAEEDKAYADSYYMAFYGDVANEGEWVKFAYDKTVVLSEGDGTKEITVFIRDDLYNEGDGVSDTITLYTAVPTVTVSGPSVSRISNNEGKNVTTFTFTADKDISAFKVVTAESINVLHDDATSLLIPDTFGSAITVVDENGETIPVNISGGLSANFGGLGKYAAGREFTVTLYGNDLSEVSPDDGVKIIKVFAREYNGNWSV